MIVERENGDREVQSAANTGPSRRMPGQGATSLRRQADTIRRQEAGPVHASPTKARRMPRPGRHLEKAADGKVVGRARSRRSSASAIRRAPFTTSTLQQEASRKLGFTAQRPCASPSNCTKASISAAARSVSSPTCAPTRSTWRRRRWTRSAALITARYGKDNLPDRPDVYQDQGQERPGGPRGDPPNVRANCPSRSRSVLERRAVRSSMNSSGSVRWPAR